jgi:hypothetical protein
MRDDVSTTSTEAGNTETPPAWVRPAKFHDAIGWSLRLEGDVEDIYRDLCLAVTRGDARCIKLRLSSPHYRMSPVQSYRALAEIDPHAGRVLIRTRDLLPRRTDPNYPKALLVYAGQYTCVDYLQPYEVEQWLDRHGISLPPQLRDKGPCLDPFTLAAQLGMQFAVGVGKEEAAAILHKLDDEWCEFDISRDWIVSEARTSQQRRAQAARQLQPIIMKHEGEIQLEHRGDIDLRYTGPRKPRKPAAEARKKPGGGKPHPLLYICRDALLDALRKGNCSPDAALRHLRDVILPQAYDKLPGSPGTDVRWEQHVAAWAKKRTKGLCGAKPPQKPRWMNAGH